MREHGELHRLYQIGYQSFLVNIYTETTKMYLSFNQWKIQLYAIASASMLYYTHYTGHQINSIMA